MLCPILMFCVFIVLFYILLNVLIYYPLEACLFSNEKQKGSGSKWERRGQELGIVEGGKIVIKDTS